MKKRPLPSSIGYRGDCPLKRSNFAPNENNGFNQKNFMAGVKNPISHSGAKDVANTMRRVSRADFKRLLVLGTGSFAKVLLVQKLVGKDKGKLYAMKVLDKGKVFHQKQTAHTMTERSVLGQTAQHPFIVSLKYAYQTSKTLNLVMDFCSGGELYYHLTKVGRFTEARTRFYIGELVLAVEHLHANNIVYRDLKPENVLIGSDGHVKLADFGLSKQNIRDCTRGAATFCGTPEYLAPEVLHRQGHGKAVDWWSLGILMYEMLIGIPPWYSKNRKKMYEGICLKPLSFPSTVDVPGELFVSQEAQHIIKGFLIKKPSNRLGSFGVEQVKGHVFFKTIDFDMLLAKNIQVPWKPKPDVIYFDSQYTRLTLSTTPPTSCVLTQGGPPGLSEVSTASPVNPSSFVDHAFNGFSYTAPSAVGSNPNSPVLSPNPNGDLWLSKAISRQQQLGEARCDRVTHSLLGDDGDDFDADIHMDGLGEVECFQLELEDS